MSSAPTTGGGALYEIRPSPPPSPPPGEDDFPSLDLTATPPPQPLLDMIDAEYMMAAASGGMGIGGGNGGGGGGGGGGSVGGLGGGGGRLIPMKEFRQSQGRSSGSGSTPNESGADTDYYGEEGSSSSGAGSYTENGPQRNYYYKVVRSSVTPTDSPLASKLKRKSRKGGKK